jgi:Tfp pilus assembly protein PilX
MTAINFKRGKWLKPAEGQSGYMLVAALTLLTGLTLLGTTAYILSSTDIKVGTNFKNSQQVLQVAMAGGERARELLRQENITTGDSSTFNDELSKSTRKGANSTLDGYTATTDDQAIATGTINGITYSAYLTNDNVAPDTTSSETDTNKQVMITTVASKTNDNSKAVVQTVVKLYTGVSSPATIYSKGDVTGNGSSLTISGNDECGVESALAPIYTKSPATTGLNGAPTLTGSPSTPQTGSLDLGIQAMIDALKASATYTLTEDTENANYGTSTSYKTVYSNTNSPPNVNGLKLNNVTGYGLLLIEGDLVLGGGFTWYGPILVTGSVTLNGGGGGINIHGQILSGTSTLTDVTINGGNVINYNSCEIKKAFATQPLTVVNWKQTLY